MIDKTDKLRKKKRTFLFMLTFVLTAGMTIGAAAQGVVTENTSIDAETVVFSIGEKSYQKGLQAIETDAAPYIKDIGGGLGRTMVPVSYVAPALGSEPAQWFAEQRKVLITKGNKNIEIFIDSTEMLVNGNVLQMDTAAEIVDIGNGGGRTMLPIAFIARALEVGYEWLGETREVYFYGKTLIFDNSVNYGPDFGIETIEGNVIIKSPGVILNDLYIKGNLIIAEEVGNGDVTLNNITVKGQTYIRGGGKDSIYINSGMYNSIIIQKIAGEVRVVAKDADGLIVILAKDVAGERIFLEGNFASVTVEAENARLYLTSSTSIEKMVLEEKAVITGPGTIIKAEVKADGVVFEKMPQESEVTGTVTIPPALPPSTPSGGGGGGNVPPQGPSELGGSVTINGTAKFGETLTANIGGLTYTPDTSSDMPSYQWKHGGAAIAGATNNTYTLAEADIGQTITVTISGDGTNATGSVTSGATAAVTKADGPEAPAAPTVDYKTHNSVTLAANADNEFSKDDGATWQNNNFVGLEAGTAYTFLARVKETSTSQASGMSNTVTITTEPTPLAWRKINALDSFPAGIVRGVDFYGDYLAAAHTMSPYISIYKREGDTLKKLTPPADLPAGHGEGVAFSNSGNYLAVVHTYSPHLTIYKRTGDTFAKLATPAGLPVLKYPSTDGAYDVAFSHDDDDTYMAVVHKAGDSDKRYLTIFKRNGDTFTKLAEPNVVLTDPGTTGSGLSVDFSPDSNYLAVGHSSSGDPATYFTIYSRNVDAFTKLNLDYLPSGNVYGLGFSNSGNYLTAGHNSPYLTVYQRDGSLFARLPNTGASPGSLPWDIAFNPDDKYLAMALSSSPYLAFYVRYDDRFVKLDNPADLPTGQGQSIAFNQDGKYMATGYAGANTFLNIYKTIDPTSTLKTITATTVGTLQDGNITSVPAGSKVFDLKSGLTVSNHATVEVLAGTGGAVVSNQTITDVTADMVVEVTAGNGTDKAEYAIVMAE